MSAAVAGTSTEAAASTTTTRGRAHPNRRGRGHGRGTPHTSTNEGPSTSQPDAAPVARSNRGRGRAPAEREWSGRDDPPHAHRGGGRRREFGAQLTSPSATPEPTNGAGPSSRPATPPHRRPRQPPKAKTKVAAVDAPIPAAQDLTTRLTESMCKPPYADCPICFNEIHPLQPTWSCAISEETNRCCWTVFHNKCIVAWSKKSEECARRCKIYVLIVVLQTFRKVEMHTEQEMRTTMASGDVLAVKQSGLLLQDLTGEYSRILNAYRRSQVTPRTRCFCGGVVDPKPGRLAIPHSCGQSCQRQRTTCSHPCPLNCHPGPCPPCVVVVQTPCHCSKTVSSMRCSHLTTTATQPSLSCGQPCGRQLQCGKHKCTQPCHPGACEPCEVVETGKCYCGKEEKTLACGEGDPSECADSNGRWVGRFTCQDICERCAPSHLPYDLY